MNSPTSDRPIRIATRASQLALWQAHHVSDLIRRMAPTRTVEIVHVSTVGDREQVVSLQTLGGFGAFTREVQKAVLDDRADLAVHSLKDLPTEPAAGLCLAAVPARGDDADVLVLPESGAVANDWSTLPQGARLGTGSLRRQAQLLHARPDLSVSGLRGNVETRLKKLDEGQYDAIVLAAAGLKRLGKEQRISQRLTPPLMYSAVGQGALGIECRENDPLRDLLAQLNDAPTRSAVDAERALLAALRAGCHAPVGVKTSLQGTELQLEAVVLSPDGTERLVANGTANAQNAVALGRQVAEELHQQGAARLIARV